MDFLKQITFTYRYWVIVLPLVMMAADVITGWIQASINSTWEPSVFGWNEV